MLRFLFKVSSHAFLPVIKLYWFVFRPKAESVKSVLVFQNEVLLIRNSYGLKLWTLPGGSVKSKEFLEDAVKRETLEEVGILINKPKKCGSLFYDGEYKKNTIWVFVSLVSSAEFKVSDVEIEEAQWFRLDQLPKQKSHLLAKFLKMAEV